jgi:cation:H+ antiporter
LLPRPMVNQWVWVILILPAFFVLNEGAKLVTDNAAGIARRSGRSKFVVGVLLVSTLGAVPEVLVAMLALARGIPDIAIGSALGSHVLNASFMIGLPAVFLPIAIRREVLARDIVFLGVVTLVAGALLLDGNLTILEGAVLILLFIPYAANLLAAGRLQSQEVLAELAQETEIELELIGRMVQRHVVIRAGIHWVVLGVLLLFIGAHFVTQGAEALLLLFGADPFFVGITVVSIGTSLPDIAAALQAVRRGHPDLALAIGIGASIFTMLLTLGIMGIAFPQSFEVSRILNTVVIMAAQILFLLLFSVTGRAIHRWEGAILFAFYPLYIAIEWLLLKGLPFV